jgi:hypothetical protein
MRPRSSVSGDPVAQAKVSRRITLFAIRLLGLQVHVAKRVLCDEHGDPTPDGAKLLALLAREARLGQHGFHPDADRRLFDAGAQHIVRLLLDWSGMDSAQIARIEQQLKDDLKG